MSITEKDICIVCAWRETCQKRFSVKSKGFRCVDFVRDITIKPEENKEKTSFEKKTMEGNK
ncbi:MAG: hypothetical protein AB1488_02870 [Nitrospirota bacterium]